MPNLQNKSARELAEELIKLTQLPGPSSGPLRGLDFALDTYRGRNHRLDASLTQFRNGVTTFVYAVQRGHSGREQWDGITTAAGKIATTLDIIGKAQETST